MPLRVPPGIAYGAFYFRKRGLDIHYEVTAWPKYRHYNLTTGREQKVFDPRKHQEYAQQEIDTKWKLLWREVILRAVKDFCYHPQMAAQAELELGILLNLDRQELKRRLRLCMAGIN